MKRGEVYVAEIQEYDETLGLTVYIEEIDKKALLYSDEIRGGLKKKHEKMIGWLIPVRIKSVRPLVLSNKLLNQNALKKLGQSKGLKGLCLGEPIQALEVQDDMKLEMPGGDSVAVTTKKLSASQASKNQEKTVELNVHKLPTGFMVWWKKLDDAACYTLRLYVGKGISYNEIDVITKERQTAYHSFVNLPQTVTNHPVYGSVKNTGGIHYCVSLEAENRQGEIVARSGKIKVEV